MSAYYSVPDPDNAHDQIAEGTLGDLMQQLMDGIYPAWHDGEQVSVVITAHSHIIHSTPVHRAQSMLD